ncbi:hypothetical protein K3555_06125 [Leisingera sp. M527]|uniref:hypothetical protein n=1 Tax=unclassified Leisingera TaxID=2614906 RepID=UPI0021A78F7B|nr:MULTISPECIES: hypothetical protein [unclassified Leisingera]UWQ29853.1 hypothetical protein K3557_04690 [Leisingera sp. M523]UWQ34073.1 hypothetical protein K3555_06125 [Leisingera sp. M527]UWQ76060.1 hypothetical protein K3724_06375 [Leisingera sp. M658]
MQLVRKKWFILFESGALLSRTGDRITYFYDEALCFGDREEAQRYLAANENKVSCTGLHPSLTEAA